MPFVPRLLLALSAAAVIVTFAVTGLSQTQSPFAASGAAASGAERGARSDVTERAGDAVTGAPTLAVRVQLPASVVPGRSRQVRIGINDRPIRSGIAERTASSDQMFVVDLDIVATEGTGGVVWITPSRVLVQRRSVSRTRFDLILRHDAPCGSGIGELRVRARSLSDGTPTGETLVSLPPVSCIDRPTGAPASVHDTERVCGGTVQETRRVPRRTADGSATGCHLPRAPRPPTRQVVEEPVDEDGDVADDDQDDEPDDGPRDGDVADDDPPGDDPPDDAEATDPNPPDPPDDSGEAEDIGPSGDPDDPVSPSAENDPEEKDRDRSVTG